MTERKANGIPTSALIEIIYQFCQAYSGVAFFPYQAQFSRRVIRSVLDNDGAEITALFARQSGKSETVATTVGALLIILPYLANLPEFEGDVRLEMFKNGFTAGIFAPSQRQASITYGRMRDRIQSPMSLALLESSDFNLRFSTSNGQTVALTNGSFATAISASENTSIEGESFKLLIIEEAQDVSDFKIRKCLSGDTLVLLASGNWKRLDEIVQDKIDEVMLYDEKHKLVSCLPSQFYDNGVQQVYEITLCTGQKIKATNNHKFLTYSKNTKKIGAKYRTVEEIKNSFYKYSSLNIAVPDEIPIFVPSKEEDYAKGLILGYFLGDGCFVGTPKFAKDTKTIKRLSALIKQLFPDVETTFMAEKEDYAEVCFSTPTNIKNSNTLKAWFRSLGYNEQTGIYKQIEEQVPYSRDFLSGIVEGLIETDGCVYSGEKPLISFSNISEKLVRQLQEILIRFGVYGTISAKDNFSGFGGKNSKLLWSLTIKSIIDLQRFGKIFKLYNKQEKLEKIIEITKDKATHKRSKNYSDSYRFYNVVDISSIGKESTYCLETKHHNFIANGFVSSNSISPMGAAYNATIVKIGTATTFIGDFYEAIERNKKAFESKLIKIKNHFEFDCDVAAKYNPRYAKYLLKEKWRLGENSDEFKMSYKLIWILQRGMFFNMPHFEQNNLKYDLERVTSDHVNIHTVGIDLAKKSDSTVITVVGVDYSNPVLVESQEKGVPVFKAYKTVVKNWMEMLGEDYESQYYQILAFLGNYNVQRIFIDATAQESFTDRLHAKMNCEVVPYFFTSKSKSTMYKYLDAEIKAGRLIVPAGELTRQSPEFKHFIQQNTDLQKSYRGQELVVAHPNVRGAHDDYPDSLALAVLATKEDLSDFVAQSGTNPLTAPDKSLNEYYRKRNCLTARRR